LGNEDDALLALLRKQPEQGLDIALQRYGNTVRWIAMKILGHDGQADVEECVSDVFVRLWQSAARFDSSRGVPLSSWVYGIARHTALDYKRRQQRQGQSLPLEEATASLDLNLDDQLARERNGQILRDVIDGLPPPDREIFIYRYFLELPVKEIAVQLQLTSKQVENKLYRGKLALRNQLQERGIIR